MSLAELTNAYDFLHSMLLQREKLIKLRIKESLKHYGKDERVLFESGDMNRELETIPDILANVITYDQHSIDQILGVNEQVQHI
jgi:transposase